MPRGLRSLTLISQILEGRLFPHWGGDGGRLASRAKGKRSNQPPTSTTYTCVVPVRSLAKATLVSSVDHEGCGWHHCGPYTVSAAFSIQLSVLRACAKSSAVAYREWRHCVPWLLDSLRQSWRRAPVAASIICRPSSG